MATTTEENEMTVVIPDYETSVVLPPGQPDANLAAGITSGGPVGPGALIYSSIDGGTRRNNLVEGEAGGGEKASSFSPTPMTMICPSSSTNTYSYTITGSQVVIANENGEQ